MSILDTLFSFQGRIGRGRWWLGVLFQTVAYFVVFGFVVARFGAAPAPAPGPNPLVLLGFVMLCVVLLTWMGFALNAKRWHDRGKSGWWTFLNLVPMIGPIWVLVELGFLAGPDHDNRFGPPSGYGGDGGRSDFDPDRVLADWRAEAGGDRTGSAAASRRERAAPVVVRGSDDAWAARRSAGPVRINPRGGFGRRGL